MAMDSNILLQNKDSPLLRPLQGSVLIQNEEDEPVTIQEKIAESISKHLRSKINNWLKWWGFRHSPTAVIFVVAAVLSINVTVAALTFGGSQYCPYLNLCVFLFQVESVVLYVCAFISVNKIFIEKVTSQLAQIDISSPEYKAAIDKYTKNNANKRSLSIASTNDQSDILNITSSLTFNKNVQHKELIKIYEQYKSTIKQSGTSILLEEVIKCLMIIFPSYASGYLIFLASHINDSEMWHIYVYAGNVMDVIRYAPQILHIALVRSYFQTFPIELQRLRDELNVIKRTAELNDDDYNSQKYVLTATHKEFIQSCERVIRPYRNLSSQLSGWIVVYLLCNTASFTFFILSVVSAMLNMDCQYSELGLYYVHYLIELWTFFAGWVFLVMPYCTNESILGKFFNDVRTMANVSAIEKCAIDRYIDSYSERSPFSIYSIKPSYSKFMNLLYIVFATITLDIVTKVYNVNI